MSIFQEILTYLRISEAAPKELIDSHIFSDDEIDGLEEMELEVSARIKRIDTLIGILQNESFLETAHQDAINKVLCQAKESRFEKQKKVSFLNRCLKRR